MPCCSVRHATTAACAGGGPVIPGCARLPPHSSSTTARAITTRPARHRWEPSVTAATITHRARCLPTCIGSRSWCDSYGGDIRHGLLGAARDPRRDEPPQPALFHSGPSRPLLSRAACWLWARTALAGLGGDRDRLLRRLSKALPPPDREVLADVTADPQRWAPLHRRHRRGVPPGRRRGPHGPGYGTGRRMRRSDRGRPAHGPAAPQLPGQLYRRGHLMGLRHAGEAVAAIRGATAA